MATIVYQKDKRSGITYAYESVSYWDKEKKQSRAKRALIGRVDNETGVIIPTDGRGRKKARSACRCKKEDRYPPRKGQDGSMAPPISSMQLARNSALPKI